MYCKHTSVSIAYVFSALINHMAIIHADDFHTFYIELPVVLKVLVYQLSPFHSLKLMYSALGVLIY